ncbi:MAG TPA: cation:proton antiporter [Candidatus Paceibacterota bacterium]|nr:cation:proton antiporter [Candidatus Paceibacterota bacterium]
MNIFVEIGIIVFIATAVCFLMRMLKQPIIVGYILSGIILGPYFLNLIQSSDYLEAFSKIGIAILLFIVGLNLKPDVVREVGKVSLIAGIGQMLATSVLSFLLLNSIGFDITSSIYISIAISFSSTIIVLKLLSDKGDLNKLYGKISVGFLIVQDIFATLVLLGISILNSSGVQKDFSSAFFLAIKCVFFFLVLYIISKFVLPRLSKFLTKSSELLFLFSISWGLGLAVVFYLFGFSLEIGALAAGVALSSFNFSQEIAARLKPLRDFFVLLFFVMLGSQMVFAHLSSIIVPALIVSLFVLILKPMLVFLIMNILGYGNRTSFSASVAMAQISEFSLILAGLGLSLGHINNEIVSLITLVGIITIAGSTYLILYSEKIYDLLKNILQLIEFNKKAKQKEEELAEEADLLIFGYDRVGYDFVKVAKKMGIKYLVVDFDPEAIKALEEKKVPCAFGDADDIDFLDEIKIHKAKMIVSTIPEFKTNLNLVSYYKNHNPNGIIVVISHNIKDTKILYKHGASFVVMPHYLGAKHAAQMIENFAFKDEEFERERKQHLEYLEERQKNTK